MINQLGENKVYDDQFENFEGYQLEILANEKELIHRMETVRQENKNEVSGFVVEKDGQFGFYYQISNSPNNTSDHSFEIYNSWHSHPDSEIDESMIGNGELYALYQEIDEPASEKISLIDLIIFLSNARMGDLISLPPHHLLFIKTNESIDTPSLTQEYQKSLRGYYEELTGDDKQKQRQYHLFAAQQFKAILQRIGIERMTKDNFLQVLDLIGLKYEYIDINDL